VTTTVGSILAVLLAGAAYAAAVLRRNRRLVRPPILGVDGAPLRGRTFTFSDGETVDYVDVGPTDDPASGDGHASAVSALFLVPGADGMKETFRYQVPALARRHRVICASLRERFAPDDTLDRMVDDVAELASAAGLERFVLLGQSLGGSIAMRFAVRDPERATGLVLANTLARIGYEHVGLNRALLTPLAMFTTRYLPTALGRAMARLWSRLDVWIYDSSPGGERVVDYALWTGPRTVPSSVSSARVARLKKVDLRPQLPAIRAPTLVLKGPRDHYVPPAWSHEIASLVPGARYEEVPGTGHCSHVSMPGSFNRRLSRWLEAVARREAGAGASDGPNSPGIPGSPRLESEVCE
jgi:3-oxoadipate enol-lactonase